MYDELSRHDEFKTSIEDRLENKSYQKFFECLGESLRYQLCLIPEKHQISVMNTSQQYLMVTKDATKRNELKFQQEKSKHGGSRWMFKHYDTCPSSWIFDLTSSKERKEKYREEPVFSCSLKRMGTCEDYFRVVSLCEVVNSRHDIKRKMIDGDREGDEKIETWIVPQGLYIDRVLFVYRGDFFEGSVEETTTTSERFRRQWLSALTSIS